MKRNTQISDLPQFMKLCALAQYLDVPYAWLENESARGRLRTFRMAQEMRVMRRNFEDWLHLMATEQREKEKIDLSDLLALSEDLRRKQTIEYLDELGSLRAQVKEMDDLLKSSTPAVPRVACALCHVSVQRDTTVRPRQERSGEFLCDPCFMTVMENPTYVIQTTRL